MQSLQQLQSLGKHLDAVEASSCKKSTDSQKIENKGTRTKSVTQSSVTQSLSHPKIP